MFFGRVLDFGYSNLSRFKYKGHKKIIFIYKKCLCY